MSDTVIIVAIIAVTITAILFMVRARISRFLFKADREGLATEIETDLQRREVEAPPPPAYQQAPPIRSVRISNTLQAGEGHLIDVNRGSVEVEGSTQLGKGQAIVVRPDDPPKT